MSVNLKLTKRVKTSGSNNLFLVEQATVICSCIFSLDCSFHFLLFGSDILHRISVY